MHAGNETIEHTPKRLLFFFPWREGGGWIKKNSCVSIMLLACPHIFSRFWMCSSRFLPITPHFIPYALPKLVFPFSVIYRWGKEELLLHILGRLQESCFFCVGAIKMAHCQKKQIRIWEAAHLMKTWVYSVLGILLYKFSKIWKFPDFGSL